MRKTLLLFTTLSVLLLGCGEAGVETDISKINELDITFNSDSFTELAPDFHEASVGATVNLASEEFDEYLGDIENYIINKLEVQILDLVHTGDAPGIRELALTVFEERSDLKDIIYENGIGDTPLIDAITDSNRRLRNTEKILIYDKDDASGSLVSFSNEGIQQVLTALENESILNGVGQFILSGDLEGSFTLRLFFDITARAQLD